MGWFKDVLGGVVQGFAGGNFGASVASGAMGLGGSLIQKGVGNALFGMPTPKTGGPAGVDRFEYMNKAFPGTTALERLGGASQGPGNAVQAGKQASRSQRKTEIHQMAMQSRELASREKIAGIAALAPGRQAGVAEQRFKQIEIPRWVNDHKKFAYEFKILKHQDQIMFEKALASYYDWERAKSQSLIGKEHAKQEQMKTRFYQELIIAGFAGKALAAAAALVGLGTIGGKIGKKMIGAGKKRRITDVPQRRKSDAIAKPKKYEKGVVTDPRLLKGKGSQKTPPKTYRKPRYTKKGDAKFGTKKLGRRVVE